MAQTQRTKSPVARNWSPIPPDGDGENGDDDASTADAAYGDEDNNADDANKLREFYPHTKCFNTSINGPV